MTLAWTLAALQRQKKLPTLETLLAKRMAPQKQTPKQLAEQVRMLSQMYKIPLRRSTRRQESARG